MIFSCQNLQFFYDFTPKIEGGLFNGAKETLLSSTSQQPINIWPTVGALDARAMLSPETRLEGTRYVVVDVTAGDEDVLQGEVSVRGGSAGLRLRTSEAECIEGDAQVGPNSQTGVVSFQGLSRKESFRIKVPYQMESDMRNIVIKLEVNYTTAHGTFTYAHAFPMSVVLPLGVNVQDIFKHSVLFSKFAISTSTLIPLRLLDCRLEGTEDYTTSTPHMGRGSLLISARQPASMVYKITPSYQTIGRKRDKAVNTRLLLKVKYKCLDEEILSVVKSSLTEALSASESSQYTRLLVPHVEFLIRNRLPTGDLETTALLREVTLAPYSEMQWPSILKALPRETHRELATTLDNWHRVSRTIGIWWPFTITCERY